MATFNLMDKFRERFLDAAGGVDLEYSGSPAGAVLKMALASALTVDQNVDITQADLAVFTEVTGTGYTAGGNACANATVTIDGAGLITVDADDPATWSQNAGGFADAVRAVLLFDNGGAQTTWEVVGYSDAFAAAGNVAGDFTVQFAAAGIFTSAR